MAMSPQPAVAAQPSLPGMPQCPPAPQRWHCPGPSRGPSPARLGLTRAPPHPTSPGPRGCCGGTRRDSSGTGSTHTCPNQRSPSGHSSCPGPRLSPRSSPGLRSLSSRGGQRAGGSQGRNASRAACSCGPRATAAPADRQVSPSPLTTGTRPCPDRTAGSRASPGEGFRHGRQAWVSKPRAAHPHPENSDRSGPSAQPGGSAGPGKGSGHSRATATGRQRPGSAPEALTAQGPKQEAGTNGQTGGPG